MGRELETEIEKQEEARSSMFFLQTKKPYEAALHKKWGDMAKYYDTNPDLLLAPLTLDKDTAFHIAAYSAETELLRYLLGLLKEPSQIFKALSLKNSHGNTTFHEVATTDKLEAAQLLISKLQGACAQEKVHGNILGIELEDLLEDRNHLGETPLYRAAALGRKKMLKFFAKRVGNLSVHFHRNDSMSILHIAVIGQHFETALWLLKKDVELGKRKEINGMTCLHLLAKMPSAFKSSSGMGTMKTLLYDYCLPDADSSGDEAEMEDLESGQGTCSSLRQSNKDPSEWSAIKKIWEMKKRHTAALKLTKLLAENDNSWDADNCGQIDDKTISLGNTADASDDGVICIKIEREQSNSTPEEVVLYYGSRRGTNQTINYTTPLLIAVSEEISDVFDAIITAHPQAIEHVTKDEENILHVAIKYRQREIFRRVKNMTTITNCRLASRIDKKGNTILHHVANTGNYDGGTKAGPALQLQEELKWLERVQKIMPSHYVMHRNDDNKTAEGLFKETHAELLKKAQKWIKETAQSCSAVAVLVATVVFAAAYTVPGGNNDKGYPNFLRNTFFLFFTIMDVVSLASSLTSVVMFLSILTSPFEQENFYKSLPLKLKLGFSLLFFSVVTTMLSFTATILLIIKELEKKTWTTTLIYTVAFFPVSMFALMQFPLFKSFIGSLHYILKKIMKKARLLCSSPVRARSIN